MAYMPFLYYYLGPAAFLSYLLAGRSLLVRSGYWGWIFGVSFTAYVSWLLYANGVVGGLHVVRFFWGFLLFYFVFKSGIQIQADKLLLFLSALTLLEAVLVNTFINAASLPNYPASELVSHFVATGEYQRPYSFGGSASVTSVILAALLAVSNLGWRGKSLVVAAIISCMSGSGFLALAIYFLVIAPPVMIVLLVPMLIGIIYSGEVYKLSEGYLTYLYEYKVDQAMTQIPMDSLLMGVPLQKNADDSAVLAMGGDFAFFSFIMLNGFAGLFLLLSVIYKNINKKNWLPLLIMLSGTLHYGVIYFFPGQLVFGYLLNLRSKSEHRDVKQNEQALPTTSKRTEDLL